jgi:MFS family permease
MTQTEPHPGTPGSAAPQLAERANRFQIGRTIVISLVVGIAVAVLWSAQLVDDDIGVNVADGLLGHDAASANLAGTLTGLLFAFITGVAGTFTACNVAVFSAIAPMVQDRGTLSGRIRMALRPLGWVSVGAVVVAGLYGAIGARLGSRIPQLSTRTVGNHFPVRLLQSVVVFGAIGLIMLYLGLAALNLLPDPLGRLSERWPPAPQLVMGALIGAFLVGRPWPLFHKMFLHAASTHNALAGGAEFMLVAAGNMLLMGVLYLLLAASPFPQWLRTRASRVTTMTAAAWLIGGSFTFVYWVVRLPAHFGYGWFPTMPWH